MQWYWHGREVSDNPKQSVHKSWKPENFGLHNCQEQAQKKKSRQTMIIVNKAMIPNVVENYLDLSENRPQV